MQPASEKIPEHFSGGWRMLQGPSISIDTACSSSLVTAHIVCGCLRHSGCARGLSVGVNLPMNWETSFMFVSASMTAADGRCKTLDSHADGYVRSEACMAILFRHACCRLLPHAHNDDTRPSPATNRAHMPPCQHPYYAKVITTRWSRG